MRTAVVLAMTLVAGCGGITSNARSSEDSGASDAGVDQAVASDAAGDVAQGASCKATIDDYCAASSCIRNWSQAQDPGAWCALFKPNGYGVSFWAPCSTVPYDVVAFGQGADCGYVFYYAPDTGDLVQVNGGCNQEQCLAGPTPTPINCTQLSCSAGGSPVCPGPVTNASCSSSDAGGDAGMTGD